MAIIKIKIWSIRMKRYIKYRPSVNDICVLPSRNGFKIDCWHGHVIQQFIGQKDSKGREIYEGDILLSNHSKWTIEVIRAKDWWIAGWAGYVKKYFKNKSHLLVPGFEYGSVIWEHFTIIGNIKSTPHLRPKLKRK